MMVANHFDVRWVDGYSAVSDVPSSLAAVIEKLAADLPASHDQIELAVRDVRRSDGTTTWVGLLRFVVVVSSVPRPLGFLHAAVMPAGYRIDPQGWRAVVARRYGEHPEERIRTLYEELAESTKDIGRDRLRALAIRPEDLHESLEAFEEDEPPPNIPRTYTRPGTRPPKSIVKSTPPASAPPKRASAPTLPLSMRVVDLPAPPPEPSNVDDLRDEADLANDTTQPMSAPSGTARPISGEHPQHRPAVDRVQRAWWALGAAVGAMALLLGAMAWLAHRHVVLIRERDRLSTELAQHRSEPEDLRRTREELDRVKRELEERRAGDKTCSVQTEEATKTCKELLNNATTQLRDMRDQADRLHAEVRVQNTTIAEANRQLAEANSKSARLNNAVNAEKVAREEAERLHREERQRASERDAEQKRLQGRLVQQSEQLRLLSRCLQSARAGEKPPPTECRGIK